MSPKLPPNNIDRDSNWIVYRETVLLPTLSSSTIFCLTDIMVVTSKESGTYSCNLASKLRL